MIDNIIEVECLSKQYRLGEVSTGTISHDLNRLWCRLCGKPDPTLKVTHANVRDKRAENLGSERRKGKKHSSQNFSVSAYQDFSPDYVWALQDIDFDVKRGEVLGIIGRNGAGKSTLLKILSRVTAPTTGEIRIDGSMTSLLEVGTGFHPELTGRENIFLNGAILGMTKSEIRGKLDEIVEFSGCARYLDTPVKRYSSGMIVRLGFAVAAHLEPDILIVDEVLAVGDLEFQKKCLGKMKDVAGHGRTVLFVSHNMAAVQQLCSRVLWVEQGRVKKQGESFAVVEKYQQSAIKQLSVKEDRARGYIYMHDVGARVAPYTITGIQLLDEDGEPKTGLATWDFVCFRIHYHAEEALKRGSVVLQVHNTDNSCLLLCSTQPDSNVPCEIKEGDSFADCIFPRWPLSAGKTLVNAGLAIPNVEFITTADPLCQLYTMEKHVYGSSIAPCVERYLIAADHHWVVAGQGAQSGEGRHAF